MRKSVRSVLFYLFFAAFCILAPLIVLYTAGYRFSIKSGIDLDVGSLSITTQPRRAFIFINGEQMDEKTPRVFQELQPGRHRVELTRSGFLPWNGVVFVVPGLTTYLQHIVLFRNSTPTPILSELEPEDTVAGHHQYIAYTRNTPSVDLVKTLSILNIRSGYIENLATFPATDLVTPKWSPEGMYLLVQAESQTLLFTKSGEEITPEWWDSVTKIQWDSTEDILYVHVENGEHGEAYQLYDPTTNDITRISAETIGVVENAEFFIKQSFTSSILAVRQLGGEQEQELVSLPRSEYTVVGIEAPYLALQDAQNDLLLVNPTTRTVTHIPAQGGQFEWNKETHELAYTDGTEFNLLTLQQQQRDMLFRSGAPLTDLAWHPSGQRLLFAQSGALSAIDVYQYGFERDQVTLATFDTIESFWMDQKGREAYVLGTLTGNRGLYSLRLR